MKIRLVTIRSAFYSPVIVAARLFLDPENLESELVFRDEEQSKPPPTGDTLVVEQMAPSASMLQLAKGNTSVPIHIASINTRDGFYLVAREPRDSFDLKDLEGSTFVPASFAVQPEACLVHNVYHHISPSVLLKVARRLHSRDRS